MRKIRWGNLVPKSTLLKFSWNLFIRFFWYWQYSNRIEAFLREFLEKLFLCPKWGKLGILGNKINTFWLQVLGETVHCYFVLVLSWSTSLLLLLAMVSFAFSFLLSLALLLGLVACCPLHLFGKKVIISPDFFVVFYFFPPNWGIQFFSNLFVNKSDKVFRSGFVIFFDNYTEFFCNEKI